jgi:hypothetical protein
MKDFRISPLLPDVSTSTCLRPAGVVDSAVPPPRQLPSPDAMLLLKYIFVILHVATAAAWFGMGLRVPAQARVAQRLGAGAASTHTADARKGIKLMGIFITLTLVFGLTAFFLDGGFAAHGPEFHSAITVVAAIVALNFLLLLPAWDKFAEAIASNTADDVDKYKKRVGMGVGIGHLLWFITLILMFWQDISGALLTL